ncbi:MAG TPA: flagellar type III secretion system pore protein FliP [Candidatus Acidoferrum sp.]|nr:flagellar type III secretion system pore protein FliP [Candidatus Acidoferrum sp.]
MRTAAILRCLLRLLPLLLICVAPAALADASNLTFVTSHTDKAGNQSYSISLQVLFFMTLLSLLPALLMSVTSFTRIIVVLAILRQALGLMQTPSNQVLLGLSLFMTFFIMSPVFEHAYQDGIKPYMDEKISFDDAMEKTTAPFKHFMLNQTRDPDLALFSELGGYQKFAKVDDVPLRVLIPSFVTSELKTAFQIGFLIFIPFLIIDLVVASVLMSMGMMMLSPMLISLPFKIMLFVLVDGWTLIMGTLASSFFMN